MEPAAPIAQPPVAPVASPGWLRVWILAARPRTLTAAVVPVLVGTAVAAAQGAMRPLPAFAALFAAICIQIGTNFANDYHDFERGADTHERVGPQRVTQSGLVAPRTVRAAALGTFGLALAVGIYLAIVGGWPILITGLASIAAGWAYTGGPWPFGYHGLGDLFVFVFFGLVATAGTTYVQIHAVPASAWIAAIAVGALATAILVVNNLRDIATDARAGKRTLAVRLGASATRAEYVLLLVVAFVAPVVLSIAVGRWALLPLAALPLAVRPLRLVFRACGAELNAALGATARLQLVYGVLLAVGLVL
ncbi:MAG TPA: 1,4-dihydroxy-2-naphthoate polyprenyltransferase [Myxococcales bacterium]|nr:1,4-dihydroxy-2-naphthoate polyprenyltransferase [Myxococcales bacterium]